MYLRIDVDECGTFALVAGVRSTGPPVRSSTADVTPILYQAHFLKSRRANTAAIKLAQLSPIALRPVVYSNLKKT